MKVDEATVHRIARLARIKVSAQEAKGLETELTGILDWVKMLDEVDTCGRRADDPRRARSNCASARTR